MCGGSYPPFCGILAPPLRPACPSPLLIPFCYSSSVSSLETRSVKCQSVVQSSFIIVSVSMPETFQRWLLVNNRHKGKQVQEILEQTGSDYRFHFPSSFVMQRLTGLIGVDMIQQGLNSWGTCRLQYHLRCRRWLIPDLFMREFAALGFVRKPIAMLTPTFSNNLET